MPLSNTAAELVREANHRVANSLAQIASLVRMQASKLQPPSGVMTNEQVAELLDSVAARIATVGQLHRLLAYRHDSAGVDIGVHLHEICAALVSALASPDRPVELDFSATDGFVSSRHAQSLSLIVSEIVINAIKYAHPEGRGICITVRCERTDDGVVRLRIEDDGVGFADGFDPERDGGLGFRIVRSLAADLGASHEFSSSSHGTRFRLELETTAPGAQ